MNHTQEEQEWKKATMRHFSQNTGEFPEIDGILWVASEDVKAFIKENYISRTLLLEMIEGMKRRPFYCTEKEKMCNACESALSHCEYANEDHAHNQALNDLKALLALNQEMK